MSRRGITIVEFLIVLAVIGILVGIATPSLLPLYDRGRLNEALNSVEFQVAQARRLAKRLDRPITFAINQSGSTWRIVVDGAAKPFPAGVEVTTGNVAITLEAPHGVYTGAQFDIGLKARSVTGTATVTGILPKVVQR